MDASSYGRMVERGGYASGGPVLVGESGPEMWLLKPGEEVLTPAEYARRRRDDGTAGVPAKV
jgi:hypothetical protein